VKVILIVMGSRLFARIILVLVLASFIGVAFFSLILLSHGPNDRMTTECPFSAGVSLCPQDSLALIAHHISAYSAFFAFPPSVFVTVMFLLLLFWALVFILSWYLPLSPPTRPIPLLYTTLPLANLYKKRIVGWLSLLENSPQLG